MVSFAHPSLEPLGLKVVPAHGVELGQLADVGSHTREAVMRVMETVVFPPDYSSIDATNAGPGARMVFSPSYLNVAYDRAARTVHLAQDAGITGVEVDVRALGGDGYNDISLAEDGETLLLDGDVKEVVVSWGNNGKRFSGFHLATGDTDAAAEAVTDVSVSFEGAEESGVDEPSGFIEDSPSEEGGGDETPPPEPEMIESLTHGVGGGYGLEIDELNDELVDPLRDNFDGNDPLGTSEEEVERAELLADLALNEFEYQKLPDAMYLENDLFQKGTSLVIDHQSPIEVDIAADDAILAHQMSRQVSTSVAVEEPLDDVALIRGGAIENQAIAAPKGMTPLDIVMAANISVLAERARAQRNDRVMPTLKA